MPAWSTRPGRPGALTNVDRYLLPMVAVIVAVSLILLTLELLCSRRAAKNQGR
ncbi:hypothetical protein [Embleya scabrispora]|uniref:hypothetical protein n=1 Tax=Embleya scabrispora TaxID=159449 RepID=UPI0003A6BEDC